MAYPERKPIYDAYKEIIEKIIDSKLYKQYAESEINALNNDLLRGFKAISSQLIAEKDWTQK